MLHILIVDDSRIFRHRLALRLQIERLIHVAGMAKNGQEAVLLVEKLHPDVILMDQNLHALNGVEATKEAKKRISRMSELSSSRRRTPHAPKP